jgi:hypothetical protein
MFLSDRAAGRPLSDLVEASVSEFRRQHRVLEFFAGATTTYAELGEQTSRAGLRYWGAQRATLLSLILPNCPQHVARRVLRGAASRGDRRRNTTCCTRPPPVNS